ncbi:ABC transporter ATP-binding protein [Parabacteroides bouchesdurhonensis]|uniref:ABC transporter ATP-binding protein n=1 Tax=Parabacteroides bouchesdurhonensis TaxID=1936995 RepID=UPI000E54FC86|nr:ABC transporter ATP-binding protein [Parabacteroides bouchesdurhonensis]RHJ90217.1 ABC transporter ATP-binding protein [Bacteroides sp. AM07-16]
MTQVAAIETKDLSIGYVLKGGRHKVVHDALNLQLYAGEVTCLLGLNGAGKSTLLRTLCGFQPPLSGAIRLMGDPLEAYSQHRFALTVGVVLTEKTNAGGITVYELVSLGRHPYTGFFGQLKSSDKEIIMQSLESVGIVHKANNYVSELSDGERQKAMIAKALAQQCPIILLDEPTAFLDVTSRIETMVLLHKLATEQQKTVLLSTHDLDLAIQMGDCLWLQEKGRAMACGTPEDLIMNGAFGTFFGKDGIVFDPSTGKLNVKAPVQPVGVEGDFQTSYWVGNALIRNGYRPSPVGADYININCKSSQCLDIVWPDGTKKQVASVAELISEIKK